MLNIENVHFQIQADGTTRHLYEPRYIEPLLKAMWVGSETGVAEISFDPIDPANPYTGHLRVRSATLPGEMARLRQFYEKHPRTGGPLFDLVYSTAAFEDAFQREAKRGVDAVKPPAPVDIKADLSELIELPVIGEALAAAIHKKFNVATPEELMQTVSVSDLQTIPRIGPTKAKDIYEACLRAVHTQAVVAEDDAELKAV